MKSGLTIEHAVGNGAAWCDGLVVVVVVGGALLTGSLQEETKEGQKDVSGEHQGLPVGQRSAQVPSGKRGLRSAGYRHAT